PALIITDKNIVKVGLLNPLIQALEAHEKAYHVYSNVRPNPTVENVEEALALHRAEDCGFIIAMGGGSPMDCAKVVGARVVKPNQSVYKMSGVLKILKKLPPMVVIPTTAGTGSETTVAAIISDDVTNAKLSLTDTCLIPQYVAFIPELTVSMPPHITATTGMDALTHAIECYIGQSNTKGTLRDAIVAMKLIQENLLQAYHQGDDLDARRNMLYAAFFAGRAFTKGYVGNAHAISHAVGGLYHIPHGLANAIALPVVLRAYGDAIQEPMAEIAENLGLCPMGATSAQKAAAVIAYIEKLNETMNIPTTMPQIRTEDLEVLSRRCSAEANPLYPVPVIWTAEDFKAVLQQLKGVDNG
ncbi:MAG: iron-containing alcohol dehydrogenase, partial [Eubacteriales bacterium]